MANERGFAIGAAVRIRGAYEAGQLCELAKRSGDAAQTRRLLALAAIYDGGARSEAGQSWWCRLADGARLGAGLQCRRPERIGQP